MPSVLRRFPEIQAFKKALYLAGTSNQSVPEMAVDSMENHPPKGDGGLPKTVPRNHQFSIRDFI